MTNAALEGLLRSHLAAREPATVPPGLVDRVAAVPDEADQRRAATWAPIADWLGVAAAVSVLAFLVANVGRLVVVTPGAVGPSGSAPVIAGSGLATAGPRIDESVAVVLVLGALGLAALRLSGRLRLVPVALAAVVAVVALWAAVGPPLLEGGTGFAAGDPVAADRGVSPDGRTVYRFIVGSDPIHYAFPIRNDGPVAITVLGLDRSRVPVGYSGFVGLGFASPSDSIDLAHATAFQPTVLAPGQEIDVLLLAVAGTCQAGAPPSQFGTASLVYDVAGWRRSVEVRLPVVVEIDPCSG